jgi:iron complex outermembrane receptor protein
MFQRIFFSSTAFVGSIRLFFVAGACFFSLPAFGQTLAVTNFPDGEAISNSNDAKQQESVRLTENVSVPAIVVISNQKTRSSVSVVQKEIEKLLPGTNPLKAIHTLPGVSFQTADPWGNNEQNLSLFVHGFSGQQLGYTLDGVPLGDQQYGNYNGLSPQRAVISENVRSVLLSSGAGDLATASTSNLGGTIETFSDDPLNVRGATIAQTIGSHSSSRSFIRFDSGNLATDRAFYVAFLRQKARAWDFDGLQGGNQINAKFVDRNERGKLSVFVNYSDKTEPNEDSTVHVAGETTSPYTRPFLYPDFAKALSYLMPNGATPIADGANYRNYFGVAQRTDYLTYAKYELDLNASTSWTNQVYFHHDDGLGAVAGPIVVAGLPALFRVYFPQQDLKQVFGGSGYAVRTTEYWIKRGGVISTVRKIWGKHQFEMGGWYERNQSSAYRRWYQLDVNQPITPYVKPRNPVITQYGSEIKNHVFQMHMQDDWRPIEGVAVQAGFKTSLQFADGQFPVQPAPGAISGGSTALPVGEIITKEWFLPQFGVIWDLPSKDQAFVNIQRNLRQFVTYGAVGASPWSLSSQSAFDLFKSTAKPETSVTYEAGIRGNRNLNSELLTAIEGQVTFYHVDFNNRLLQISPTPVISSIVNGNPILANVGSVNTNGVDFAATLRFGRSYSFYNALSYNSSTYANDYANGKLVVPTAGKLVPGSPTWLNKFSLNANFDGIEAQLIGDYVGKRYATYTNDLSVPSYFLMGFSLSGKLPVATNNFLRGMKLSLNVSNLANKRGILTPVVGAASATYNSFPIAPRQVFLTIAINF